MMYSIIQISLYLYREIYTGNLNGNVLKVFFIVADVSVYISYIIIWKQTVPESQWLNIQQFIYLLSQGLLRVEAMFQGSCLPCGSSEPLANLIMWHFLTSPSMIAVAGEEGVCTVLWVAFALEFIFHL